MPCLFSCFYNFKVHTFLGVNWLCCLKLRLKFVGFYLSSPSTLYSLMGIQHLDDLSNTEVTRQNFFFLIIEKREYLAPSHVIKNSVNSEWK